MVFILYCSDIFWIRIGSRLSYIVVAISYLLRITYLYGKTIMHLYSDITFTAHELISTLYLLAVDSSDLHGAAVYSSEYFKADHGPIIDNIERQKK